MTGVDTIELFYSAHCVACPEARALLRGVADARPGVVAVEHDIDGPEGLARAQAYCLVAVPAFVVNQVLVSYGLPTRNALVKRLTCPSAR